MGQVSVAWNYKQIKIIVSISVHYQVRVLEMINAGKICTIVVWNISKFYLF